MNCTDINIFEVNDRFADTFTVSLAGVYPENGIRFDIAPAPLNVGLCFCVSGGTGVYSFISGCGQRLAELCIAVKSNVQKLCRALGNKFKKFSRKVRIAAHCATVPRCLRL